jgi:hypothetical protein
MGRKRRAAHAGNARVPNPLERFFFWAGKRIEWRHQFNVVLFRFFFTGFNDNAQTFGIVLLKPGFDLFYRTGNGRVNRDRHKTVRRPIGDTLAPLDPVAYGDKSFVWRAEMLVYGNDHLFGKRGSLCGLSLGGMFPGIQFKSPAKCAYSHKKAFSWIVDEV